MPWGLRWIEPSSTIGRWNMRLVHWRQLSASWSRTGILGWLVMIWWCFGWLIAVDWWLVILGWLVDDWSNLSRIFDRISTTWILDPQMVVKRKGNPFIWGKCGLMKYFNLARLVMIWLVDWWLWSLDYWLIFFVCNKSLDFLLMIWWIWTFRWRIKLLFHLSSLSHWW